MKQDAISLPIRRSELIEYLNDLIRTNISSSKKEIHSLGFSFHFFLDDTNLLEDPYYYIGYFLIGVEEAYYAQKVARSLNLIIEKYGGRLANEEYLVKDEWLNVVSSAKEALFEIKKAAYNFSCG